MYAIYREVHPPTGIEHCLECHFVDGGQKNLVVAATSVLKVFRLVKDHGESDNVTQVPQKGGKGCRLVQIGEYHLHGNIQSMDKVRLVHGNRDTLLLTFKDAKLSLVEYDPEVNDLKVVSLHQFEEDDIRGGNLHNVHRPYVHSDPEGRCAAMLMYGTHLAVLPLRHTSLLDEPAVDMPLTPGSEPQGVGHSFTIDLRTLSERVAGVKDFQFIHGYNSPTVFILYEPTPTWAGRITLRKDTCSIVALSLNLSSNQNSPIIWQVHGLPFDSSYCVPVPRPIGGMLIVGANTLLYMNQSSPSVGVGLNSHTDNSTNFNLRIQSPAPLALDCSKAVFVDEEHLVVTLKDGDIYILRLIPEGMKGIRNIIFEKTAAGVLASCICKVGEDHVFLGSRLGNSLLLHYSQTAGDDEPPPEKKRRKSESISDTHTPDGHSELEMYRGEGTAGPMITPFHLEVADSLMNIAPIKCCTVGQPGFQSEEFMSSSECNVELVTVSGHGKNGSLCVLQRGVRPQIVTTFELPGCKDMWTVHSKQEDSGSKEHGFLILSQEDSTMVLQTGQEITELDSSGFAVETPTVCAGNIVDNQFIIQVTTTGMRLLRGSELLARVALDMGGGVRSCDIADPYAVILLADGTLGLVEVQDNLDSDPSLQLTWPEVPKGSKVTLISAYTDKSGLFTTTAHCNKATPIKKLVTPTAPAKVDIDDEDELLYGDISALESAVKKQVGAPMETDEPPSTKEVEVFSKTHWVILYREDGSLEIYSIPTFDLVFCARNFSSAPKTLMDSGPLSISSSGVPLIHSSETEVNEVLMTGLGGQPRLMALVDRELVVYTAFRCPQPQHSTHLQLRFSKVHHEVLLHDRKAQSVKKQLSQQNTDADDEQGSKFTRQLRVFENIAGYTGVFVCGVYPHWAFMSRRGTLQLHPMTVDGPALSFAPFNNVNCCHGFLYFNSEGELRVCVLPSQLTYDAPWPVRRVPTHSTVHYASFHMESKTHAVVTSEQTQVRELPIGDDPDQTEKIERDDRFVYPMEDKFYLQLYSPLSWEPVPNTKYSMDSYERVVSCKVMRLRSQETLSGRKEYIVVGSTILTGEEFQCKGKIRIFDVVEVIPEPGKPLTKHKLKCLYNQEQKGTISALEAVDGLILACMGQRIFMWHFKDNKDLMGMAFIDTDMYTHTAIALKNFILIGDISHSVQLLRYKENLRTLSLISRDAYPSEIYACDYVIDGQQLGFVASDSDQNIVLYQYQPERPESNSGQYLTRRGDFNVGSHVNTFVRVHCKSAAPPGSSSEMKALMVEKRDVTFFATLDGGIGYILPVAEKTYRRLVMLQSKLVQGLPHIAGLNPKAFRMYTSHFQYLYSPQRNILDGKLLWRYTQLYHKEKTDFAKQIGTTSSQIIEDLKEIDKISSIF